MRARAKKKNPSFASARTSAHAYLEGDDDAFEVMADELEELGLYPLREVRDDVLNEAGLIRWRSFVSEKVLVSTDAAMQATKGWGKLPWRYGSVDAGVVREKLSEMFSEDEDALTRIDEIYDRRIRASGKRKVDPTDAQRARLMALRRTADGDASKARDPFARPREIEMAIESARAVVDYMTPIWGQDDPVLRLYKENVDRLGRGDLAPTWDRGAVRNDGGFDRKKLLKDIAADQKRAAKLEIEKLKANVRVAKERGSLKVAKAHCRTGRVSAREQARALEAKAKAVRHDARSSCDARVVGARSAKEDAARAKDALEREKKHQRDLRRIESGNRKRAVRVPRATKRERTTESDDEVRANIPPELVPLFNRVKRSIKATDRSSRTEVFLEYAEEHPGEELASIDDETDAMIAAHERAQRGNPGAMIELGKLTSLRWVGGSKAWDLSSAPALVYDGKGRLLIVYGSRPTTIAATAREAAEYIRSHWGTRPKHATVEEGELAAGPFAACGVGTTIVYTTKKGDAKPTDYVHDWGEGKRGAFTAPKVLRGAGGRYALRGGSYRVTERGIVG